MSDAKAGLPAWLDRLYAMPDCAAGGPLHIVTDDYNVEDRHLEFCADRLGEWPAATRKVAEAILSELRKMPVGEREAALGKADTPQVDGWLPTPDAER